MQISPELTATVVDIAREAGGRILQVYETDFAVERKDDKSPLTQADLAAHNVITSRLGKLEPHYPVLSEESAEMSFEQRAAWDCFWLVDPLDGTREFVKRNGEFTVNIALITKHSPVLGVIYVPVSATTYYAARGQGAFKQDADGQTHRIHVRSLPDDRITVAGSRSHGNDATRAFIGRLGDVEMISIGSSLKTCLVAEGRADVYPRFGPTSEWDTAAAQCVVEEAGGHLTDTELKPLRYNTKASLINPHFIVFGDSHRNWRDYF